MPNRSVEHIAKTRRSVVMIFAADQDDLLDNVAVGHAVFQASVLAVLNEYLVLLESHHAGGLGDDCFARESVNGTHIHWLPIYLDREVGFYDTGVRK